MNITEVMDEVEELARDAARVTLEIYRSGFDVEYKDDDRESPLTEADRRAHRIITTGLEVITPEVPIISEESRQNMEYEVRKDFDRFWLVDPLDGTKEFIKQNDEFTVNIGLIEYGLPVAGVVVAPALDLTYRADGSQSTMTSDSTQSSLHVSSVSDLSESTLARSRSHSGELMQQLLDTLSVGDEQPQGSSLKICRVAEGVADVYCRFGPTWEWDTAAADAVLRMAGGKFTEPDGNPLIYNKPSLKNERGLLVTNGLLHEQVSQAMSEILENESSTE